MSDVSRLLRAPACFTLFILIVLSDVDFLEVRLEVQDDYGNQRPSRRRWEPRRSWMVTPLNANQAGGDSQVSFVCQWRNPSSV